MSPETGPNPPPDGPPSSVLVYTWMDPENPRAGGDVKFLTEICLRLVRDGSQVRWVASRIPGRPTESRYRGIEIYRIGSIFSVFFVHHFSRRARGRARPTLVLETVSSVPFFLRTRPGENTAAIIHHVIPFSQFWRKVGPLAPVVYILDRILAPMLYRTRPVLVPSLATEREVRGLGYAYVFRFKLGADPIEWDPDRKQALVVAPGPVKPWKHHEDIIRAFTSVGPEWKLVVFGSFETSELERTLRRDVSQMGLEERVQLLGRISEGQKIDLLRRASVCVMASEKEGWCLAAMEAQAAGCPVVAYAVEGLTESVVTGKTGLLVPPGDRNGLAHALARVTSDARLRHELAEGAAVWSRSFDWESSYRDFCGLLRRISSAPRPEGRGSAP